MKVLAYLSLSGLIASLALLLAAAAMMWPPKYDLAVQGGVQLIYGIDRESLPAGTQEIPFAPLVRSLEQRLNPRGTREVVVRRFGEHQVEVILPNLELTEIEAAKQLISTAGVLEFRIVANRTDHRELIEIAEQQSRDEGQCLSPHVTTESARIGYWAQVARDQSTAPDGILPLKVDVLGDVIRDARNGQLIDVPADLGWQKHALERWLDQQGIEDVEVLMAIDDYDMTGDHLAMIDRSMDETLRPCINFSMSPQGAKRMQALTGENLPDQQAGVYRRLGIMLDGRLLSAPRLMSTISDRGRITGQFSMEEVDFLVQVLQAGSLPVPMEDLPMSEASYPPDVATRSTLAVSVAAAAAVLIVIWLVMLIRHGLSGLTGVLASMAHVASSVVILLASRTTMGLFATVACTTVLVAFAFGCVPVCRAVHRAIHQPTPKSPVVWKHLTWWAVAATALVTGLLVISAVVVMVTFYPYRPAAVGVACCALAAIPTLIFWLPLTLIFILLGWTRQVPTAEYAESQS